MQDSDQEIVRRVLSSILDRLNGSARVASQISGGASVDRASSDQGISNHNASNDNSIILVVMGQGVNAPLAQAYDTRDDRAKGIGRAMQATHPVFERFPIAEAETVSPAPKTCFMEPGRVCVNSGACEMRGY